MSRGFRLYGTGNQLVAAVCRNAHASHAAQSNSSRELMPKLIS
jgi:hypothetical protein